jgi:ABC-type sugar transport system permease subunit
VPVGLVVVAQLALLVYTGFLSTQDWTLTQTQVSKGWIGDQNFTEVLDDPVFWRSVVNSALITGISVPIQLFLGILLAYATFELAAGRWVRTALLAPMVVAPVAVGIVWRLMLNVQAGPINSFVLAPLGIDGPIWLGEPGMAVVSVIAVEVWEWTPFVLLLAAAGLTAIREDLREAARTDGASTWQRIRYIELPVLKPVILIIVLFRTLESLMSLDVIISLTRGGPGFSTFTLPYYIYSLGLRTFDIGRASAASLLFMAIAVLLSAAIVRVQLRTDTT